jgi:hypothetical protein
LTFFVRNCGGYSNWTKEKLEIDPETNAGKRFGSGRQMKKNGLVKRVFGIEL